MGSTSMLAATATGLRDHAAWRPEWSPGRTCLYWYLTFREDDLVAAVGEPALVLVERTEWLDAVPPRWCHVTVADVAFADQLGPQEAARATTSVADALSGAEGLSLSLGPVQTFATALVLTVGPLDRLRSTQALVRRATSAALGPRHADVHRRLYWPHVSLGYVNRAVEPERAADVLDRLPEVSGRVGVDAVTLAAVTRSGRGYRWEVVAQVDLVTG